MILKIDFTKHVIPLLFLVFVAVNCSQTNELTTSGEQAEQDFFNDSDEPQYVDVIVAEEYVNTEGDTSRVTLRNAFVELRNLNDYSRIQSYNSDARGRLEIPVSNFSLGNEYIIVVSEQQSGATGTFYLLWDDYYSQLFMEEYIPVILGRNIRSDLNTERNRDLQPIGDPRSITIN